MKEEEGWYKKVEDKKVSERTMKEHLWKADSDNVDTYNEVVDLKIMCGWAIFFSVMATVLSLIILYNIVALHVVSDYKDLARDPQYQDKVWIREGFYYGETGVVTSEACGFLDHLYGVQLDNGPYECFTEKELVLINEKGE